jgi:tetratricopeptide (TPR) repeat protein
MPAHTYMRVGRYADAAKVNEEAIVADEDYITQCRAQGIYPVAYYPHNIHFLTFASMMEGRSKASVENARKLRSKLPTDMKELPPWANNFSSAPYFAMARFGQWDAILAEPKPDQPGFEAALGVWHYARGLALLRTGKTEEAQQEHAALAKLASDSKVAELPFGQNNAGKVLDLAVHVLRGEIAAAGQDRDGAIAELQTAVKLQDAMRYDEPENWYYPIRQSLGAVLLDAGRAREAEQVYRDDLKVHRKNGWSLFGLVQSLKQQGRDDEAAEVEKQFTAAWQRADVKLTASRF